MPRHLAPHAQRRWGAEGADAPIPSAAARVGPAGAQGASPHGASPSRKAQATTLNATDLGCENPPRCGLRLVLNLCRVRVSRVVRTVQLQRGPARRCRRRLPLVPLMLASTPTPTRDVAVWGGVPSVPVSLPQRRPSRVVTRVMRHATHLHPRGTSGRARRAARAECAVPRPHTRPGAQ